MKKVFSLFLFLVAVSAIVSGYGLVTSNGLGMPVEWLGGAFSSFTIPGVILGLVVGGTYLTASISIWRDSSFAPEATATAGFGIVIWIFTQLYIVQKIHILQVVYFAVGIITLILTMLMLKYGKQTQTGRV